MEATRAWSAAGLRGWDVRQRGWDESLEGRWIWRSQGGKQVKGGPFLSEERTTATTGRHQEASRSLWHGHYAVQFSSVTQSCPTLCDPMDHSTPGFPVHHQLPEFTQTHVHRVGDAIQPSHPLLSSSPTFNLSQHQGPFPWVSSHGQSIGVSASASELLSHLPSPRIPTNF